MSILEVLNGIKDRLKDPSNWIQGKYFADKSGNFVAHDSGKLCKCCLQGAIWIECFKYSDIDLTDKVNQLFRTVIRNNNFEEGVQMISQWNDSENRTHSEVVQLIDNVIYFAKNME